MEQGKDTAVKMHPVEKPGAPTCGNCMYFVANEGMSKMTGKSAGECRLRPPKMYVTQQLEQVGNVALRDGHGQLAMKTMKSVEFVPVLAESWCGEHPYFAQERAALIEEARQEVFAETIRDVMTEVARAMGSFPGFPAKPPDEVH